MSNIYCMNDLIKFLNYHTDLYNKGIPEISDKEWDKYYFKLEELEKETGVTFPNSPTQKIEYKFIDKLEKVEHNHKMLSLAKTKDWFEFLNYFNNIDASKSVIGMPKLDGLTCSLKYLDGKLVSAETRGDGLVGENILHNIITVKGVPNTIPYKDELIIDGEIICTFQDFEEFKEEYANPRNFASGSIRLLDAKECASRNLTFVVWNVVKGFEGNRFLIKLEVAKDLGFITAPWASSFDWDAKEWLVDKAKELGYPIDGLVGRFDDIEFGESLGSTDHHARAAYAFKFYDEAVETTLQDIEWTMGRTGQITPIAIFKTLDIDGSNISKASLSNLSIMKKTLGEKPFIGQTIYVSKRNMIIPKIEKAKDEYGEWIQ